MKPPLIAVCLGLVAVANVSMADPVTVGQDARAERVAVAIFGNATCEDHCVAVVAVGGQGTCEDPFGCYVAVATDGTRGRTWVGASTSGPAEGDLAAASIWGNATSCGQGCVAATVFGNSSASFPLSVTGGCASIVEYHPCFAIALNGEADGYYAAMAANGNASGGTAVSVNRNATGDIAITPLGDATGCIAVSVFGNATTTDRFVPCMAVSVFGEAGGDGFWLSGCRDIGPPFCPP